MDAEGLEGTHRREPRLSKARDQLSLRAASGWLGSRYAAAGPCVTRGRHTLSPLGPVEVEVVDRVRVHDHREPAQHEQAAEHQTRDRTEREDPHVVGFPASSDVVEPREREGTGDVLLGIVCSKACRPPGKWASIASKRMISEIASIRTAIV